MVYQLNIQTIPLTRRSRLIVRFGVADTAAWVWSITAAVRRARIRTACLSGWLHHIAADAYDLPRLARFRAQAPGWKVLCARDGEIVIGTRENATAGLCLMPVTDPKTVKNRLHLDLTSSAWSLTVLASPATSTVRSASDEYREGRSLDCGLFARRRGRRVGTAVVRKGQSGRLRMSRGDLSIRY
jgi:hypothetical protein